MTATTQPRAGFYEFIERLASDRSEDYRPASNEAEAVAAFNDHKFADTPFKEKQWDGSIETYPRLVMQYTYIHEDGSLCSISIAERTAGSARKPLAKFTAAARKAIAATGTIAE